MTKSRGIGRHPPSQRKHGHSWQSGKASSEYNAWKSMRDRCTNPAHRLYSRYGGRGITVCSRWLSSFEAFLEDMGPKPAPELSLERIDNDRGYDSRNCKWATKTEQAVNRHTTRFLTIAGERMCLSDAAKLYGIPRTTLRRRLDTGWPLERALRP